MLDNKELIEIFPEQIQINLPQTEFYQINIQNITIHKLAVRINCKGFILKNEDKSFVEFELQECESKSFFIKSPFTQEYFYDNSPMSIIACAVDLDYISDHQLLENLDEESQIWQKINIENLSVKARDVNFYFDPLKNENLQLVETPRAITKANKYFIKAEKFDGTEFQIKERDSVMQYMQKYGKILKNVETKYFILIQYENRLINKIITNASQKLGQSANLNESIITDDISVFTCEPQVMQITEGVKYNFLLKLSRLQKSCFQERSDLPNTEYIFGTDLCVNENWWLQAQESARKKKEMVDKLALKEIENEKQEQKLAEIQKLKKKEEENRIKQEKAKQEQREKEEKETLEKEEREKIQKEKTQKEQLQKENQEKDKILAIKIQQQKQQDLDKFEKEDMEKKQTEKKAQDEKLEQEKINQLSIQQKVVENEEITQSQQNNKEGKQVQIDENQKSSDLKEEVDLNNNKEMMVGLAVGFGVVAGVGILASNSNKQSNDLVEEEKEINTSSKIIEEQNKSKISQSNSVRQSNVSSRQSQMILPDQTIQKITRINVGKDDIIMIMISDSYQYIVTVDKTNLIAIFETNNNQNKIMEFWEYSKQKPKSINFIFSLQNNDHFVIGGNDECYRVYSIVQKKMIKQVAVKKKYPFCAAIIKNQNLLAIGGKNLPNMGQSTNRRNLKIFEIDNKFNYSLKIDLPKLEGDVMNMESFSTDDPVLKQKVDILAVVMDCEKSTYLVYVHIESKKKGKVIHYIDMGIHSGIKKVLRLQYSQQLQKLVCLDSLFKIHIINVNFESEQLDETLVDLDHKIKPINMFLLARQDHLILQTETQLITKDISKYNRTYSQDIKGSLISENSQKDMEVHNLKGKPIAIDINHWKKMVGVLYSEPYGKIDMIQVIII